MKEQDNSGSAGEPCLYHIWQAYQGRGLLARTLGDLEQAVLQFSIAARICFGSTDPEARLCRGHSLVSLGSVYLQQGRYDRALIVLQEAMKVRDRLIPLRSTLTAEALRLLANAHRGLKQFAEADALYAQANSYLFELLPAKHPYIHDLIADWLQSDAEWEASVDDNRQADERKSA